MGNEKKEIMITNSELRNLIDKAKFKIKTFVDLLGLDGETYVKSINPCVFVIPNGRSIGKYCNPIEAKRCLELYKKKY